MDFRDKEALAGTRDTSKEAAAKRLKAARLLTGLGQQAFGEASGVSKAAISNAEKARSYPGREAMIFLHREHRVDFNFMIAGEFVQLPNDVQEKLMSALLAVDSGLDQIPS